MQSPRPFPAPTQDCLPGIQAWLGWHDYINCSYRVDFAFALCGYMYVCVFVCLYIVCTQSYGYCGYLFMYHGYYTPYDVLNTCWFFIRMYNCKCVNGHYVRFSMSSTVFRLVLLYTFDCLCACVC